MDDLKNGTHLSAVNGGAVPVNRQLVQLLESALNDAKAGRMIAGGVVAVIGPSQFLAFSSMDRYPAEIIAGCQVMTSDVIIKMRQPRPGAILRAPAGSVPGRG